MWVWTWPWGPWPWPSLFICVRHGRWTWTKLNVAGSNRLPWRFWRTFFLHSTHTMCLPLLWWTYRGPLIRLIMVFFCIEWTPPIRSWNQYTTMVSILPVKPTTARVSRIFLLITLFHGVGCTPGFRPWCHHFPSVLWRAAADYFEPTSVCWWLTDLYGSCRPSAYPELQSCTHLNVHRSCRWVDAFKSPPIKFGEDWDPLVSYKSSTSPTAMHKFRSESVNWLRDAVRCGPRP